MSNPGFLWSFADFICSFCQWRQTKPKCKQAIENWINLTVLNLFVKWSLDELQGPKVVPVMSHNFDHLYFMWHWTIPYSTPNTIVNINKIENTKLLSTWKLTFPKIRFICSKLNFLKKKLLLKATLMGWLKGLFR